MTTPFPKLVGLSFLAASTALAAGALPGCSSDSAPVDETAPGAPEAAAGNGLGEFVLHVDPVARTSKLYRLRPGGSDKLKQLGPKIRPESVDNLSIEQDGNTGTGTTNNVELVTESYSGTGGTDYVVYDSACTGYTGSPIYCAKVTLRSFYTRTLNNAYVQITSVVDATSGADVSSTNGATGGDASPSSPNTAIDASKGLWRYPKAGSAVTFLADGAHTPDNAATREWTFNNPNNTSTYIFMRANASLTYKDYTFAAGTAAFVNACSTGVNDNSPALTDTSVTLPFGFTFYDQQVVTAAKYNRDGVVAFGSNAPPSGANTSYHNAALPENPNTYSTSPGLYVFWDQLNYNSSSSLCHQATGSAPNRKFIFTWKNMKGYGNTNNSTNLTFSAILSEGTDTIDFVYGTMTGAAGNDTTYTTITNAQRASGKKAVVGVEGKGTGGTTNIASPFPASLGSTDTSTGKSYRATPTF